MSRNARPPGSAASLSTTALAGLLLGAPGCAGDGESFAELHAPSHARMVELLARIASMDHPVVGDLDLRRARQQFAELPAGAPAATRWILLRTIAFHEMRLGDTRAAIASLDAAWRLAANLPRDAAIRTLYELGVANLRLGENENCVECAGGESCLIPIRPGGVHAKKEGSNRAIQCLTAVLKGTPHDLQARWLLNLAWMTVGGYPDRVPREHLIPPESFSSDEDFPRFENVAPRLGLDAFGLAGGGVADDFDRDGFLDLVASDWDLDGQLRYFRNNGDGTFSDRTEEAGLTGIFGGLNLNQADYDNDGFIDLLVVRGAWLKEDGRFPDSLLHNNGDGTFTDVTFDAGLGAVHYPSQTAAWGDYDNDGHVDLYIGNEAYPSQLFRNNGDGTFTDVAAAAGVTNDRYAKGVVFGDYDGDRLPDLFVSNLTYIEGLNAENRLYHNNGDGTFTDVAPALGMTRPLSSFPTWFWDFDNDGALDLLVLSSNYGVTKQIAVSYLGLPSDSEPDRLYRGDGRGGFREVAAEMGLTRVTQPMGCNFGDLDNDGWPDFYLGTGSIHYDALMPNLMYRNVEGKRFADVTTAGGFGHLQKGHGVVFADLDNDGDQDVYAQLGGAFQGDGFQDVLFENPGFGNHWIKVKLVGRRSNRAGIGARIRAEIQDGGGRRSVYAHVNSGGSFGANPLRQAIGLGGATRIETLEVFWPASNETQTFRDVAVDQVIEVEEGESTYRTLPTRAVRFQ